MPTTRECRRALKHILSPRNVEAWSLQLYGSTLRIKIFRAPGTSIHTLTGSEIRNQVTEAVEGVGFVGTLHIETYVGELQSRHDCPIGKKQEASPNG